MALRSVIHKEHLPFFLAGFIFAYFTILFPVITMFVKNVKTQDLSLKELKNDVNFEIAAAEVNDKKVNFTGVNNTSTTCARRYLLLTTQRSGSSWTCDLVNLQEGITCGAQNNSSKIFWGELMRKFVEGTDWAEMKWSEYEEELETAFGRACKSKPVYSIGFKLMYDQIPEKFLEDGKFENYLRENNVSIVHYVREAKILKLASKYNNANQKKEGKGMLSYNKKQAATYRDTPKLPWTEETITEMIELENESLNWQKKLQFMFHVPVYYLSYESLLNEKDRVEAFRQVSGFLTNTIPDSSSIATDGNLFQLHEPLCSDRIEDYENFRKHERVRESRSAAACDMIELLKNV